MRYVEVMLPDKSTRLYRFVSKAAAIRFASASSGTRRAVEATVAKTKYRIYSKVVWRRDEYGNEWCEPKPWWKRKGLLAR